MGGEFVKPGGRVKLTIEVKGPKDPAAVKRIKAGLAKLAKTHGLAVRKGSRSAAYKKSSKKKK
jgi:hypothetical protein